MKIHGSKKDWLVSVWKDWAPWCTQVTTEQNGKMGTHAKMNIRGSLVYKYLWFTFALIGVIGSLRCILSVFVSFELETLPAEVTKDLRCEPDILKDSVISGVDAASETECPWNHVFSDVSNRVNLLEVAFKEQVYARESIAREVFNQSDLNKLLNAKLAMFLQQLNNLSHKYNDLELKYKELSTRVHSDELLGLVIFVVILVEILSRLWRRIVKLLSKITVYMPQFPRLGQRLFPRLGQRLERKNSSACSTPKHSGSPRNELCIVLVKRGSSLYQIFLDSILKSFDDIRVVIRPYHNVTSQEDLRCLPNVRLYFVLIDAESTHNHGNGTEKDLEITTLKAVKSMPGHSVVIIANDEGSKKLTAHSMYNTSIRLVKNNEILHALAADGRLFSIWQEMTSHQMSHLRRVIKTVLCTKFALR
ncbi:hypothetical protein CHS0354_032247 [Potamilus streckersoni]|uniref:Uncharacterized protein n=1 Tax=Potamilus streckersoni TaxID=2493646 RepID=A0AAE0RPT8_9BIVA|nr:hypothetical protein CHS0354_032247 [Potamilus streckersoni]